jgi:hypothetical protein
MANAQLILAFNGRGLCAVAVGGSERKEALIYSGCCRGPWSNVLSPNTHMAISPDQEN